MTTNQINYWKVQEDKRANQERESIQKEQNRVAAEKNAIAKELGYEDIRIKDKQNQLKELADDDAAVSHAANMVNALGNILFGKGGVTSAIGLFS